MNFKKLIKALHVSVSIAQILPTTRTIPTSAIPRIINSTVLVENGIKITRFTLKVIATAGPFFPVSPPKSNNLPILPGQPIAPIIPTRSDTVPSPTPAIDETELAKAKSSSIFAVSFPLLIIMTAATLVLIGACLFIRRKRDESSLININDSISPTIMSISFLKSLDNDVFLERPSFDRPAKSQSRPSYLHPQQNQLYQQSQKIYNDSYHPYNYSKGPSQFSDDSQYHRSVSQIYGKEMY